MKKSANLTTTSVAVAVTVVILMIVFVVMFQLYRRGQALKLSTNILAVEMQSQSPSEPFAEPLVEPLQNIHVSLCWRDVKLDSNSKKTRHAMGLIYNMYYFNVNFSMCSFLMCELLSPIDQCFESQ